MKRPSPAPRGSSRSWFRPQCEQLEDRTTPAAVGALAVGGFGLSQASAENGPNPAPLTGTIASVQDPTPDHELDDLVGDQDTQVAAVRKLLEEATTTA